MKTCVKRSKIFEKLGEMFENIRLFSTFFATKRHELARRKFIAEGAESFSQLGVLVRTFPRSEPFGSAQDRPSAKVSSTSAGALGNAPFVKLTKNGFLLTVGGVEEKSKIKNQTPLESRRKKTLTGQNYK